MALICNTKWKKKTEFGKVFYRNFSKLQMREFYDSVNKVSQNDYLLFFFSNNCYLSSF